MDSVTTEDLEGIIRGEITKLCEKIDRVLFVVAQDGSKIHATVSAILVVERAGRAIQPIINPEERTRLWKFFNGQEQWDADIRAARWREHRPTLTFNRLPAILAHIVSASRNAGEDPTDTDIQDVAIYMCRQYMDAQRMINYFFSQLVEIAALPQPHFIKGPEDQVKAS